MLTFSIILAIYENEMNWKMECCWSKKIKKEKGWLTKMLYWQVFNECLLQFVKRIDILTFNTNVLTWVTLVLWSYGCFVKYSAGI